MKPIMEILGGRFKLGFDGDAFRGVGKNSHREGSGVRTRKMYDANKVRENLDITKDSRVGELLQGQSKRVLVSQMFNLWHDWRAK